MFCNHGNWKKKKRNWPVILSILTKRISKNVLLALSDVQRQSWAADACIPPGNLTHDLLCISPVLTYQIISPTYSQLIAHSVARLAPTYCTCVTGCRPPHTHATRAGSLEGKLKRSFLLFLQEYVHLKQTKEGGVTICALKLAVFYSRVSLTLSGWHPALPHPWPQMADTQQFFTGKLYVPVHMLKLPAEELLWSALPRMTQEEEVDGGCWEEDWERRCFTHSVVRLDFNSRKDLSHHCLYSCVNHIYGIFYFRQYRMFMLWSFSHRNLHTFCAWCVLFFLQ